MTRRDGASRPSVARALVFRPLLREKTRTLLTIAGIAVGVAVIVAIQLANQSALGAFRQSIDAISGRANYQITADAGSLDERFLVSLQPLWSEGLRFAPVIDVDATDATTGQPLRLLGVDLFSDLHFRDYRYAKISAGRSTAGGALPSVRDYLTLFETDSVVVPVPFARERHLTIGSPLVIEVLGRRQTMHVRGLLEAKGPATAFNGAIAVCDIAAAQESFGLNGRLTRVDLLVPPANESSLVERIRRRLPAGTRIERPSRRNERVEKMLRAFRVNLFALAAVALLVGMFLVYNTVLISILRRRRDVGVLKVIGVSPGQIFTAFVGEGLVFGAIGSTLGIALGAGVATAILRLIGRTINQLYLTSPPEQVMLTPGVVIAGIAVGVIISVAAALQPAWEASRLSPAALIRPGLQQRMRRVSTRRLTLLAAIAFTAAAAAARLPALHGLPVGGYGAVLLVVLGFSLLAPSIVEATSVLAAAPMRSVFGIVGRLAAASLPASLRRTAVATAALSVATGMMVAVALMVGSFRVTVNTWIAQTISSDLWLRPAKGLTNAQTAVFPPSILDELRRFPFIAAIDPVRGHDIVYGDALIAVGSGDFGVAAQYGTLPMIAPRSARDALRNAVRTGGVLVSESFSLKYGKSAGDVIDLPTAHGAHAFPVSGVYRDYSSDRGTVVMDRSLYVRSFDDAAINTVVLYLRPGADREASRVALERALGPRYHAFAITNASIRGEVMKIFDQTFMITYALLGVSIVVGVLGVINTLAALILERRRDLALLRISGMTSGELRTMLLLESSLLGLASTVTGLVMGYALSWILINVINRQSFGWTIEFHTPVALIASSLLATFGASCLAGLVPARLASHIALSAEIKGE